MSRPTGYLLPGGLTVDRVVTEVAKGFDVTVEALRGPSKNRQLVVARACAMAVIRESTDWSFPQIGRYFGGRDHTTVMHHVAKVMADPELSESVRLVVDELSPPPRLFTVSESTANSQGYSPIAPHPKARTI